ncbi:MAG: NAD(+) diphosphatase [Rhodobacteraceae bacterium]|nr:NAD(+) diphosphatase [Paracoccaceae bacterium]
MDLSARVTFAGGGLERAAAIRGDSAALAARWAAPNTRVLALWRGKPLVAGAGGEGIGWLPPGHAVLEDAVEAPIFIGEDAKGAIFAADVSAWEPAEIDVAALGSFFDPTEQTHPALPPELRFAELRRIMARLDPTGAEVAVTARALLNWHASHRFCARCGQESEIVMAGWQRTCPACGAHHFPRTDPVVIMLIRHGNSVLLGRSPGWPEGMYSCLAGFVEPGETIEAAVRREVAEETGVRVGHVGYVASQPWPFPNSLMIGCVGEAETTDIVPDPDEIEDALWLAREDLVSVWAGTHPRIHPARKGAIAHFLLENWLAGRIA